MKFITVVVFILAAGFFVGSSHASEALPDMRSWEEVTANFIATEGKHANDGEANGRRLKELDPKRTVTFLIPFLAKERTKGLRLKAIGALGWSSFVEVIPALSTIAMDATENEEIRTAALNPGLRYMKNPEAVKIASALATDKSDNIRRGAYWVLSSHGTDDAIKVLTERLRVNDKPLLRDLIYALMFSNHPRAGKIIYEHVDFTTLPQDEEYVCAYSCAMNQYHIPEAQANMLSH